VQDAVVAAGGIERPPQPRHPDVNRVAGGFAPALSEQLTGQLVDAHQLVGAHQKEREQHALALAAQSNRLAGAHGLQGSENPESPRPGDVAPHQGWDYPAPGAAAQPLSAEP
jgi:hypothetical protein